MVKRQRRMTKKKPAAKRTRPKATGAKKTKPKPATRAKPVISKAKGDRTSQAMKVLMKALREKEDSE